jgi:DNA-binding PadR family transcriptional regulator
MGNRSLQVLQFFLTSERKGYSGAEISSSTSIKSGTLYPMLAKFERQKILESEWEHANPTELGRPRRRYYTLTPLGEDVARREIQKVFGAYTPIKAGWQPA